MVCPLICCAHYGVPTNFDRKISGHAVQNTLRITSTNKLVGTLSPSLRRPSAGGASLVVLGGGGLPPPGPHLPLCAGPRPAAHRWSLWAEGVTPAMPSAPITPAKPLAPMTPAKPSAPVTPAKPSAPVTPLMPSAPVVVAFSLNHCNSREEPSI